MALEGGALVANALAHPCRGSVLLGDKEMGAHRARVYAPPSCRSAHPDEATWMMGFPILVQGSRDSDTQLLSEVLMSSVMISTIPSGICVI